MTMRLDINCDLGEGFMRDSVIMPFISSCSIACGGHFGDHQSIQTAVRLAKQHNVKVGVHPSFPDRKNFGRQKMTIANEQLRHSLRSQITDFKTVCKAESTEIHHLKLHGALYNQAAQSSELSELIIDVMRDTDLQCKLYAPFQSVLAEKGASHFEVQHEAFIDRAYQRDLTLVKRSQDHSVLEEPAAAWYQLWGMIEHQIVKTITDHKVPILADTFCIHGDNPAAVKILKYIHQELKKHQISVQ